MRKYIGNLSFHRSQQVLDDPKKEALRQDLLKRLRRDRARIDARKHLGQITGQRAPDESIRYFWDKEKRPPANIRLEDLYFKYEEMQRHKRWLHALHTEIGCKLEILDAERFQRDCETHLQNRQKHPGLIRLEEGEKEPLLPPNVAKHIRNAIKQSLNAAIVRQDAGEAPLNMNLLANRQINEAVRLLFDAHIPEASLRIGNNPQALYTRLYKEWLALEVMRADIDDKLIYLKELIDSAYDYLDSPPKTG